MAEARCNISRLKRNWLDIELTNSRMSELISNIEGLT